MLVFGLLVMQNNLMLPNLDWNRTRGSWFRPRLAISIVICAFGAFSLSTLSQTFEGADEEVEPSVDSISNTEATLEGNENSVEDISIDIPIDSTPEDADDFETFIPSEDISEDYSVPFPVDI